MATSQSIVREQSPGGAELTIQAMDPYSRLEIGRKTYRFVRRVMRDPEMKARIRARAAQIREERGYSEHPLL